MPVKSVSPTRMELTRLKGRLKTATRGHKLLKDKRDELMRQFLDVVRENRALRQKVEETLMRAHGSFTVASALMSSEVMEQALLYPKQSVELDMTFKNVMSVHVPVYHFKTKSDDPGEIYPYGFAETSGELDGAVEALADVFQDMLRLAEIEKTAQLLAEEIEKTRRRVNALEYVMIPQMQESIKYISMKLEENERSATIRLMKVKDMLLAQAIEEKRRESAAALEEFTAREGSGRQTQKPWAPYNGCPRFSVP
ncbi:MAG: V-type ATP synthase subunit D, partial [Clostridiales bacterium]|nr:V-type ATP synthase subunit D [Clostridiales bacterium]